ncbi:MAG: hypothetical protein PHU14_08145 [Methylovulum sp.]|nr:hypothetical protein [Methylovulum sp.]
MTLLVLSLPVFAAPFTINYPNVYLGSDLQYHLDRAAVGVFQTVGSSAQMGLNGSVAVAETSAARAVSLSLPATVVANAPRLAAGVIGVAKSMGPVGLTLTLVPIVCSVTSICQGPDGNLAKTVVTLAPAKVATVNSWCQAQAGCGSAWTIVEVDDTHVNADCKTSSYSGPNCTGHYGVNSINVPGGGDTTNYFPPSDADWTSAVTKLAAASAQLAAMANGYKAAGFEVPLNPPSTSAVTNAGPVETTTQRDSGGNPTGSTTKQTTTTAAPSVVDPVSNVTTTNITQSTVTNVYNSSGSLVSSSTTTSDPSAVQFPTDYNRESTQQKIKDSLDSSGYTYTAPVNADSTSLASTENAKITSQLANAGNDYTGFKALNWSTWFPSFPAGSCSPISHVVHGYTVSWNLCPYVQMINEALGWLLAVFGAWGSVELMFRKQDA